MGYILGEIFDILVHELILLLLFSSNSTQMRCLFWKHLNFNILKEMGIPDQLTCLLRNWYADQEATIRTGHGTTDCFQIGKGVRQGCILSPCLLNLHAEHVMWNSGLDKPQAGIKLLGKMPITSGMQMTPPLWQNWKWRETKEPLEESKRGEWKSWLKTQYSKN